MTEQQQALRIMNDLAAMAAARLRGDAEGEALLLSSSSAADLALFGQAAAVIVADMTRFGADLSSPKFAGMPGRVRGAAVLFAGGDTDASYAMVSRPRIPASEAVEAVAAGWLASCDGQLEYAIDTAQKMCAAYRLGTRRY
jgi:hypothetical protein